MRGFDYMSASDKKKLRKEQAAAQLTERQKQAQAEAKKTKALTVTFVVIMLAIALTAAGVLGVRAVNNSGIFEKNTITATVGEHKLNAVQINYYLGDIIKNQYSQWQSMYGESTAMYLTMMGLNTNAPLSEQVTNQETGETWADNFLYQALEKAKSDYALYDKAMAEGFKLSEEDESSLKLNLEQIKLYALYYAGQKNPDKYLQAMYGYGSDMKSYEEYNRVSYIASAYYNKNREALKYDDPAIRAEDNKDLNKYTSFSYATYYLSSSSFLEGGTKDEKGDISYTDAEKDAALKKAEEIAKSLLTAKDITELDTAIKALEINKDNKNAASTPNQLVMYSEIPASMQSWIADKAREENNITIIANESTTKDADGKETKVTNGYYVVLFQARDENLRPLANVRHLLVQFEGGTTGSDGNKVYTDAEKAKAKTEAEKLLDDWKKGAATEDSFIELVKKHSDDAGSKEQGGLIEDIHRNSGLVETFKTWSIDPDRKVGDTAVIISEYGYHVMFYSSNDALTYRDYMISEDLREADITKWHEDIVKTVNLKKESNKHLNLDIVLAGM
jgi:hypothetical protein